MSVRWKRYKRESNHSYAFGVFPTLELLLHRPQLAEAVLLHSKGEPNEGVGKIRRICDQRGVPCAFEDLTIERLGARPNDYAVGVFAKDAPALDPSEDHIVLIQPSGMGNLGTIMRTMLGFGFHDLAIVEPAADAFDPQVVRASMGALFRLRLKVFPDFDGLRNEAPRTFYPLMTDGERRLGEFAPERPFSLIFGNESSGLGEGFRRVGPSVSIPQSDEIDSLNLAVAVGIVGYEVTRGRRHDAASERLGRGGA
jgi:TrmH family RNA methyltransferase